jgi:hypothetical protein
MWLTRSPATVRRHLTSRPSEYEKSGTMEVQKEVRSAHGADPRTDASTCMMAAARLRSRPMWGLSRDELRLTSATSRLLEALGNALARDPTILPPPVRRAALRLARECRGSPPPATVEADEESDTGQSGPATSTSGKSTVRVTGALLPVDQTRADGMRIPLAGARPGRRSRCGRAGRTAVGGACGSDGGVAATPRWPRPRPRDRRQRTALSAAPGLRRARRGQGHRGPVLRVVLVGGVAS